MKFKHFSTKINYSLTIFRYNYFNIRTLRGENLKNLLENIYNFREKKQGIENMLAKFNVFLKVISRSLFLKIKGLDKIAKSFLQKSKVLKIISQSFFSKSKVLSMKFKYFPTKINDSLTIFRYNYFNIRKLRGENMKNLLENIYNFREIKQGIQNIFAKFIIFLKVISKSLFLKTKGLDKIEKSFLQKSKVLGVISRFFSLKNKMFEKSYELLKNGIKFSETIPKFRKQKSKVLKVVSEFRKQNLKILSKIFKFLQSNIVILMRTFRNIINTNSNFNTKIFQLFGIKILYFLVNRKINYNVNVRKGIWQQMTENNDFNFELFEDEILSRFYENNDKMEN